jgi:methyl-accepting chemotaxis protein
MKIAVRGLPGERDAIQAAATKFQSAMDKSCRGLIDGIAAGTGDNRAAAMTRMRDTCDPSPNVLMTDIAQLTNRIVSITDQAADQASALTERTIRSVYILLLGGLALVCGFVIWVTRAQISRPLRDVVGTLEDLAQGALDTKISGTDRRDEVGAIAQSLVKLRDGAQQARVLEQEAAQRRERDRTRHIQQERISSAFLADMSGLIASLTAASDTMRGSAQTVSEMASHTGDQAAATARHARQSTQDLNSMAAAIEQMSTSISEISQQAQKAAIEARDAVQQSNAAQTRFNDLANVTSRIDGVIVLISDIAGKTNLLALNATIEAARAGEAGRGFAVVANEVKALATQTMKATQEIQEQIRTIQLTLDDAIGASRGIDAAIERISGFAATIGAAVEEQFATTQEIVGRVQNATVATADVTGAMAEVDTLAGKSAGACGTVLEASNAVSQASESVRAKVDAFIRDTAAAA